MSKSRFRLTHPIKFLIERQFVKGAKYQLLAVVALIGIISLIGGILALPTGGDVDGFGGSVWWAFLRLTDPGYLGDDEGTMRRIISTLLTVSGYVVFLGALVAIMTQWLTSKMEELEQGLTPVAVKNHIVILGWTDRTHSIVVELFQSEGKLKHFLARLGASKLRLVILAENSSAKLTRQLKADRFIGRRADEIILRTGDPLQGEHLLRADCYNASAIIIPSSRKGGKDLVSTDVETVKTLLSLSNNPKLQESNLLPYVVAEIQDEKKLLVAKRSYPGPLEVISGDSIINRLIAQNIRHVGLSEVYRELLSRGVKSDLYTRQHTEFAGKKIYEIEPLFPDCIILGLVRTENSGFVPMLNVRHDVEIQKNDRLVFLANAHDDTNPLKENAAHYETMFSPPDKKREKTSAATSQQTKKILILGWNKKIPGLIHELGTYRDIQYEICSVSILTEEERKKKISDYGGYVSNVGCRFVEADFMEENELKAVHPHTFDHILFMSSESLTDGEEADARTIVGKIMLDDILEKESGAKPQILLELANAENNNLIKSPGLEVIISPMIISHLLAQVALRRELQSIYTELFTVGGAEIEFRTINQYSLSPGTFRFSKIEDIASGYGETALGIYRNYSSTTLRKKLILNPPGTEALKLTEKDRLVVLMSY
jgi:hypothetical protein